MTVFLSTGWSRNPKDSTCESTGLPGTWEKYDEAQLPQCVPWSLCNGLVGTWDLAVCFWFRWHYNTLRYSKTVALNSVTGSGDPQEILRLLSQIKEAYWFLLASFSPQERKRTRVYMRNCSYGGSFWRLRKL